MKYLKLFLLIALLPFSVRAADFLTDNFTDPDGTNLSAHTGDSGVTYQNQAQAGEDGTLLIQSNRVYYATATGSYSLYTTLTGVTYPSSGNYDASFIVRCMSVAGAAAVQVRTGNGSVGYYVKVSGSTIGLYSQNPSNNTLLTQASFTWAPGVDYAIRFTCSDSTKKVYVNGVATLTSSDNFYPGSGSKNFALLFLPTSTSTTGFHIKQLVGGAVHAPGVTSISGSPTTTSVAVASTAATGDTGTYTAQFQRAPDVSGAPGSFADTGSAQTGISLGVAPTNLSDTGLTPSTTYWYRLKVTYSLDSTLLYTDPVSATTLSSGISPGTTTAAATGATTVNVNNTAASAGTAPYAYQFQRAPDSSGSPGSFANVGSAQTGLGSGTPPSTFGDTGLTGSTKYWYRCVVTDSLSATATTTAVSVITLTRAPLNFFLSATGSDSNSGTSSGSPWQTISKMNSTGLVPGDTISLNGGDTFSGSLLISPATQPTSALPVIVGSYGTGRATILSGTSYGVKVLDAGWVTVRDLIITGPGCPVTGTYPNEVCTTTSTDAGIRIQLTTASTWRAGIVVDNCLVTGTMWGIDAAGTQTLPTALYDGLRISNCTVHDCADIGIGVWANTVNYFTNSTTVRCNKNIRILGCNVYNLPGLTSLHIGSGFPIALYCAQDSIMERCVCHTCGYAMWSGSPNGICGPLFAYDDRCYMRFSESYDYICTALGDGNCFDLDWNCNYCVVEYCYGHDTDGSVMQFSTTGATSTGCIVRYNVFVNGGRRGSANLATCFDNDGDSGTSYIYNNVFYQTYNGGLTTLLYIRGGPHMNWYNNIFSIGGGSMTIADALGSQATLYGNTYEVRSGASFSVNINSTVYTSLAALQAAGYEKINGKPVGASGDPGFRSAGSTPTLLPGASVMTLTAYDILGSSVAHNSGVDLDNFSILSPAFDWHGNPSALNETSTANGLDAGPVRFGSTVPSGGAITHGFSF